jgi:hypothetical protein
MSTIKNENDSAPVEAITQAQAMAQEDVTQARAKLTELLGQTERIVRGLLKQMLATHEGREAICGLANYGQALLELDARRKKLLEIKLEDEYAIPSLLRAVVQHTDMMCGILAEFADEAANFESVFCPEPPLTLQQQWVRMSREERQHIIDTESCRLTEGHGPEPCDKCCCMPAGNLT